VVVVVVGGGEYKLADNEAAPVVCLVRKPVTYGTGFKQWTGSGTLSPNHVALIQSSTI